MASQTNDQLAQVETEIHELRALCQLKDRCGAPPAQLLRGIATESSNALSIHRVTTGDSATTTGSVASTYRAASFIEYYCNGIESIYDLSTSGRMRCSQESSAGPVTDMGGGDDLALVGSMLEPEGNQLPGGSASIDEVDRPRLKTMEAHPSLETSDPVPHFSPSSTGPISQPARDKYSLYFYFNDNHSPNRNMVEVLPPATSIRLGRLFLNARLSCQEYIDPLDRQADLGKNWYIIYSTGQVSNSSKPGSYLSGFRRTSDAKQSAYATIRAPHSMIYELVNIQPRFNNACTQPEIRQFLAAANDSNRSVYLLVGYRTVKNALHPKGAAVGNANNLTTEIAPANLAADARPSAATCTQSIGGASSNVPDERVFAIQYRKVRFTSLYSRPTSKMSLGPDYRLVTLWNWQPPSEGE